MQNNIKPNWQDFYEMCKPRVVLLMLLCTLAGMFLATDGMVPLATISYCLLGVALVSGSAAALNHLVDASVDAKMARTHNRPVAQGRVSNFQGGVFVAITLALGMAILMVFINSLTAWLNLAAWAGYGIFYSVYLKRATSQNIVIGGLFGAAPPLFGWTAVTNSIDGGGLLLVLIIFVWTPPHFWALAIDRIEEYKLVEYPMLPVTHGEAYTRLQILLYTVVLVFITLFPYIIGMSNLLYLAAAVALGAGFIYWAIVMYVGKNARAPLETFRYSIIYLAGLFGALLVDHYLMPLSYV